MSHNKISAMKKKDDDVEEIDLDETQISTTNPTIVDNEAATFDIK